MQSILQSLLLRLTEDKLSNDFQLVFASSLKTAGVVENVTVVVCEDEFVLDCMQATLHARCSQLAVENKNKPAQPRLWVGVQPG
jgi:hypothetical protein